MKSIRIGTRGSQLALIQTELFLKRLFEVYPPLLSPGAVEVVKIKTTGDKIQNKKLADIGGKGLFAKEIERALISGDIDMAVHSMKDVPSIIDPEFTFACYLHREAPWDCFVSPIAKTLDDLPEGARIGTSSPRRAAITLAKRPDLKIVTLRGNVPTRYQKLLDGDCDATYLALAGLRRMGMEDCATTILDHGEMLPACGQGVIGIETLSKNSQAIDFLSKISDYKTTQAVTAERSCLAVLNGNCHSPVASYAYITSQKKLLLSALAAREDGSEIIQEEREGPLDKPEELGRAVGKAIKDQLSEDFFRCLSQ